MISIRYDNKNRYTKKLSDNSFIIKKTAQNTLELEGRAVIDDDQIIGIITDGDIRRMLEKNKKFNDLLSRDIMTSNLIITSNETLAVDAIRIMEEKKIGQLIIVNSNKQYIGIIHILDLIKEGISI